MVLADLDDWLTTMEESEDVVLSFIAEWFDPYSQLLKEYLLVLHTAKNEVEMTDLKTRRKFLKKTKIPSSLTLTDFSKGSKIILLSRELNLIDYADTATQKHLQENEQKTTVLVFPSLYEQIGDIVTRVESEGFPLVDVRSIHVSSIEEVNKGLKRLLEMDLQDVCSSPNPYVALSFRGSNSIASVKASMESSQFRHGLVCPSSGEALEFSNFFLSRHPTTATLDECTCCVIKPHIIKARQFGAVLSDIISRGFVVSAMQMFHLDRSTAAEFFAVYKGIFPEYLELVDEMCSGPLIALEIKKDQDIVEDFRFNAGPWDYSVARELHPESIRSKFGSSSVRNAIHCTDLPKDGTIECEYFFKTLARQSSS